MPLVLGLSSYSCPCPSAQPWPTVKSNLVELIGNIPEGIFAASIPPEYLKAYGEPLSLIDSKGVKQRLQEVLDR